jgi:hypothetical protein
MHPYFRFRQILLQKSQMAQRPFSRRKTKNRQSTVDRVSNLIPESLMRLARRGVVPHVVIQSSHRRLEEFESHAAKRLLQQNLHFSEVSGLVDDVGLPKHSRHRNGETRPAGNDGLIGEGRHPMPACKIVAVTLPPALIEAGSICLSMAVQSCVPYLGHISAGGQRIDRAVFYYMVGILYGRDGVSELQTGAPAAFAARRMGTAVVQ